MSAWNDNPNVTGPFVTIGADDSTGRRSRASQLNAERRAYERTHGVRLTPLGKPSYDETPGFLHRTSIRYRITR